MPLKPLHPCAEPACPELVRDGPRCPRHAQVQAQRVAARNHVYEVQRGSATARGYDAKWSRTSRAWRRAHPLCEDCREKGRTTLAECVDHVIAWQRGETPAERERLKFDPGNLRSLCNECHRSKTAKVDGALGNPRR